MIEIKMHLSVVLYIYFPSSLLLGSITCFYKVGFACYFLRCAHVYHALCPKWLFYPTSQHFCLVSEYSAFVEKVLFYSQVF